MTVRRYAVLNSDYVKINGILIEDPFPAGYWPGYGKYLVNEDPGDPDLSAGPGMEVLSVRPQRQMQMGDILIPATGTVFSFVPGLIQQLDQDGNPIDVKPPYYPPPFTDERDT